MNVRVECETNTIFEKYWLRVREQLDLEPFNRKTKKQIIGLGKSEAIQISGRDWREADGVRIVRNLFDCLECDGWSNDKGANWVWRFPPRVVGRERGEVALELEIARIGGLNWSRQMSTASGIEQIHNRGEASRRRGNTTTRSIDLVHSRGDGEYTFIELKIGANNPLYAIFELLSYGLSCYHARNKRKDIDEKQKVLMASRIDMLVLGCENWYQFQKSKASNKQPFDYSSLLDALNAGLTALTQRGPHMALHLGSYKLDEPEKSIRVAPQIIRLVERFGERVKENEQPQSA